MLYVQAQKKLSSDYEMLTFSVEKQIRSFNAKIFREIENYFNLCIRGRMVKNFMTLSLSEPCLMLCIVRVCLLW